MASPRTFLAGIAFGFSLGFFCFNQSAKPQFSYASVNPNHLASLVSNYFNVDGGMVHGDNSSSDLSNSSDDDSSVQGAEGTANKSIAVASNDDHVAEELGTSRQTPQPPAAAAANDDHVAEELGTSQRTPQPPAAHQELCEASKRLSRDQLKNKSKESFIPWTLGKDPIATIQRYSPHFNIQPAPTLLLRQYIWLWEEWHGPCKALDVGGRNGELRNYFKKCAYHVLERDPPKAKNHWVSFISCDIYKCPEVPACSWDIITMRNVMEHLLKPHEAMITMSNLLRAGGLLLIWSPWTWRYHAQETYGDYWRYSARALEYLCIEVGLNPVNSFYEHKPAGGFLATGRPNWAHGIDVPPDKNSLNLEAYVVCYKPRPGERVMDFKEVGSKPVSKHPRFSLDYEDPLSERQHASPKR